MPQSFRRRLAIRRNYDALAQELMNWLLTEYYVQIEGALMDLFMEMYPDAGRREREDAVTVVWTWLQNVATNSGPSRG